MKISQDMRVQMETQYKQDARTGAKARSFESLIRTETGQLQKEQLNRLLAGISAQGERLARDRSFRELAKYKKMIREFVKESVQYGMNLKHSHSWSRSGQNRKLTIVEEVDEKLAELTEAVMTREDSKMDLLGLIGEIKGLLINLYT
ncbi:YaaR family protein [Salimicrobium salexigens]|uniref:DUF327 domain-containing protein n=1 Tax=Salimicrobium salexigens TaxID=908941 RepID=A0ABY1KZD7_9BACI|nr:YaaR family protein [Salimicrobium salexigens]SIS97217.1 hypothetical protein SAMN05421758_11439 [Salimicrobium salexigens]